eukprot:TRINITY_DN44659_c0_g1_i1.p1 TRINITY_DN44659_c0_g1~~TRINITY_DN44659_c0_g1_i1.p1  ORF type:complete len:162 (+),score=46.85 TRINITY_DN44659_c0_g1_i1:49-486(+)
MEAQETAQERRARIRRELYEARSHWSSGLFKCHTDCGTCMQVCCCFPCQLATMKSTFDETAPVLSMLCACMAPCTFMCLLRHEVRVGYGIQGSWPKDLCASACCMCCSACQVAREVKRRGKITNGVPLIQLMELEQGAVEGEVQE